MSLYKSAPEMWSQELIFGIAIQRSYYCRPMHFWLVMFCESWHLVCFCASCLLRFAGQNVFVSWLFHIICGGYGCCCCWCRFRCDSRKTARAHTMLLFLLQPSKIRCACLIANNFTFWPSWQRFILAIYYWENTKFCCHACESLAFIVKHFSVHTAHASIAESKAHKRAWSKHNTTQHIAVLYTPSAVFLGPFLKCRARET